MTRWAFALAGVLLLATMGTGSAVNIYTEGTYHYDNSETCTWVGGGSVTVHATGQAQVNSKNFWCEKHTFAHSNQGGGTQYWYGGTIQDKICDSNPACPVLSLTHTLSNTYRISFGPGHNGNCAACIPVEDLTWCTFTFSSEDQYTVSGTTACLDNVSLYIHDGATYQLQNYTTLGSSYSFPIFENHDYMLVFSNGAYYDFTCTGDEVFNYDACIWVYGYTCGVDSVKLYKDDGGWVLDDSVGQSTGYDVYEMQILNGDDYKISFIDSTIDGNIVVHNQTFSCTGDHVLIDFDRCLWVYPPNGPPLPIYVWTGYDFNIVVFKDNHGNMVENAELAVYDNTDNAYIQKWTGNKEGYALLGAKFDTDHDVLMMLRTFDGVFTLDTTYPANGSAPVGEEDITTTNWTIPIKYNLNILPVDQYAVQLFDVFCGLSEYTPLNPQAFWGMDLSDRGYVPVTNCSGFAMCDIIAEKEGYTDYKVEALNWTSKSALVKDYRHNIVMEEV